MKRMKKLVVWLMALCMMASLSITALADNDSTSAVAEARNGVFQVRLYYVDQKGQEYALQGGSGFLIGASSGATTVITNYHVISIAADDAAAYSETFGVDFTDLNSINLKYKVVVKRDVEIEASYVNGSSESDFAILNLSQAIYDRAPLELADSDEVTETQTVYALGFPDATSSAQYTSEDVTITNGIVGKFQDVNNNKFILHNAALGYGNSGGPLVDEDGHVVGINTMFTSDDASNYYYSLAINEVSDVLDALGITYVKADESDAAIDESSTASSETIETSSSESEETTRESSSEASTESDPEGLVDPEADSTNLALIAGIIGAVILVVVIIIVIIVAVGKSKEKKAQPFTPIQGGQTPPYGGQRPPYAPGNSAQPSAPPVPPANAYATQSTAGETSVLGAGETSVLGGGGAMQPTATLIRRKNNETVQISKAHYTVGRERTKVDFCIPDNNNVGRVHAYIVCKGGVYYIVDNNSTNFTYVNGNKVSANTEVRLNSGDKIKLADEEFEFRL